MAKVVILGAGVMGSAMSMPLAANRHQISLVGTHLDDDIIRSVQGNGYHPSLKTTLPEQVNGLYHSQFADTVGDDTELIILGVNSHGVIWALRQSWVRSRTVALSRRLGLATASSTPGESSMTTVPCAGTWNPTD